MAKYSFTATHGVLLSDIGAHFERDHSVDGAVYVFATDDAKQAAALRKVDDYGITEVKEPAEPAEDTK